MSAFYIITCPDDEALAAISTSEALNIYLLRVTRSGYDVLGGDFTVGMGSHAMLADAKHTEQRRYLAGRDPPLRQTRPYYPLRHV